MGLLDSNMKKSELITKKSTLCKAITSGQSSYSFANQHKKDTYIEVIVDDTVDNNVTIQVLGASYSGISGIYASASLVCDKTITRVDNTITLKKGKTLFKLPREKSDTYQSISINLGVSASAKASIQYYFENSDVLKTFDLTIQDTVSLMKNDIYEVEILSATDPTINNYCSLRLISPSSVYTNDLIKTDGLRLLRSDAIVIYKSNKYYIDLTKSTVDYYNLYFLVNGTASASIKIKKIESIPVFSERWKLFTTTSTIGDAYYYKRKASDKYILAIASVTNYVAGNNKITFSPRRSDGFVLNNSTKLIGSSVLSNNIIQITSVGVLNIVFDATTTDLDRIHASATLESGTELTIEFLSLDSFIMQDSDVANKYYSGENILISKYKEGIQLFARYENWEAYISGSLLTVSDGSTVTTKTITDLPEWKSGDVVKVMGFIPYAQGGATASNYSRETKMRLCLVTLKGNIYHNYPAADADDLTVVSSGMNKFDLSVIYQTVFGASSLSSERIPSENDSLTEEEEKTHRYEPGLPSWNYTQHTNNVGGYEDSAKTITYGSGGQPPVLSKKGYKHIKIVHPFDFGTNPQNVNYPYQLGGFLGEPFAVKPKMTVFCPYVGVNPKKNIVLGTVDGGRSWYVLHELGIGSIMGKYGNSLDYSSIGAYTTGALSVSERVYNYPSSTVKDPVNAFKYKSPVLVTSIVTSVGKTTITTSSAHGINDGSYIVFKKNTSSTFDFLSNTVLDGVSADFNTNSCGNGRFYSAKVINATSFEILQCMGGADEKVNAHHIHGASTCKDGVVISCGEQHPNGWVLYIPIHEIDDYEYANIWAYKYNNQYAIRLNSSNVGVQRPVGFILNDDVEMTFLFASDEGHINRGFVSIEGRNNLFKRNSAGVFKGKINDIDDLSKSECVLEIEESSLGLIKKQGFYIVIGMSRNIYISKDAKNWMTFPLLSSYQGEGIRELFFLSGNTVFKLKHV